MLQMFCVEQLADIQNVYRDLLKHYIKGFKDACKDKNVLLNIELKEVHSLNVAENCLKIAKSENLNQEKTLIAYLCGLFHDVGRFEQFTKYHTFKGDESLYHGELGVEVIKKEQFFKDLPKEIQDIICTAVYNHGLREIQADVKNDELYFSKLVRDADKIDIYRIVCKYYNTSGPRNIALEYGLDDKAEISTKPLNDFINKNLISKEDLESVNDFKLMQISWIYDLNFNFSKQIIKEKAYIDTILDTIKGEKVKQIIKQYITL